MGVNLGKKYAWSGTNLEGTAAEYRFVLKGTGDTMIDNGTSGASDPTKMIISDDLLRMNRCALLLKAEIKVGTAVGTIDDFDVHAMGFSSSEELTADYMVLGSGEQAINCLSGGSTWTSGISQPSHLWLANLQLTTPRTFGYRMIRFSGGTDGLIFPFRWVGVQLVVHFTGANSNEYQITGQWMYE